MKTNQDTISEKYKIALQEAEKRGYDRCLAEQKFSKPCTDKFDELLEKRAYANGFKEGEIKGLSESITVKGKSHLSYYQQGYALGQSDLKARLMSKEMAEKLCILWYKDIYYKNAKEDIFKKNRRENMKSFIEQAIKEAERK